MTPICTKSYYTQIYFIIQLSIEVRQPENEHVQPIPIALPISKMNIHIRDARE